jgi:hypothetical protein
MMQTPEEAAEFEARWHENPRAALQWLGQRRQTTMSLFTAIATAVRTRQVSLTIFGRQFLIRFDPQRQTDPVEHTLWNILGFNLSGGIDRYSAQVEGFVAVLGFTVDVDLAFSAIGTGGLNLVLETPLFALYLTVGTYLPEPEEQPVRGRLA